MTKVSVLGAVPGPRCYTKNAVGSKVIVAGCGGL
jgi:hypothetical protein